MAEFFSLGGGGREATSSQEYHHHHQETTNNTHNWFLYTHHDQELPTYKGFELWQQQQQQQSHNNDEEQNYQILRNPIINPFGLDIGPSHDHHHHHHHETNMMMRSSTITISCQDCGNQAKKDCQHMRCRTCCKSRGFQCQTHVKSTWVPAAKRRDRQQQLASLQPQEEEDNNKSKRQKADSNTGLEVANNFPSKVNSTAVFQRVRMSSIEENEDQIAYQAAVNINGHIFKGILYDQGDNHEYNYMNGGDHDSSSGGDPVPRQHNLNVIGTAMSAANDATVGGGGVASAVAAEGSSHFVETSLYSSVNTFVADSRGLHTAWCGPCRFISPFLVDLAKKLPNVTFLKVDIDELKNAIAKHMVSASA